MREILSNQANCGPCFFQRGTWCDYNNSPIVAIVRCDPGPMVSLDQLGQMDLKTLIPLLRVPEAPKPDSPIVNELKSHDLTQSPIDALTARRIERDARRSVKGR